MIRLIGSDPRLQVPALRATRASPSNDPCGASTFIVVKTSRQSRTHTRSLEVATRVSSFILAGSCLFAVFDHPFAMQIIDRRWEGAHCGVDMGLSRGGRSHCPVPFSSTQFRSPSAALLHLTTVRQALWSRTIQSMTTWRRRSCKNGVEFRVTWKVVSCNHPSSSGTVDHPNLKLSSRPFRSKRSSTQSS